MDGPESGTQLFLVMEAGESAVDRLAAALAAASVPSVLVMPSEGQALTASGAAPLVRFAQSRGAAALLLDEPGLARQLDADGVHLSYGMDLESRYHSARQMIGRSGSVGFDAGDSRHDAMSLAEAGADYVAFSIPAGAQNTEAARERRLDLVAWWAEIFEVPCVALEIEDPEEAAALARAGADFIGLRIATGVPLPEIGQRIRMFCDALEPAATH